eukprot:14202207-Alexandrium_andersonii.AAC.1
MLCRRGLSSVCLQWVKGHAQQSHIDQGRTTCRHKEANDRVDRIADVGELTNDRSIRLLCDAVHGRREAYVSFVKRLQAQYLR